MQHEPWQPAPITVCMGLHTGAVQAEAREIRAGGQGHTIQLIYPVTHTVDQVDDYHGTRVADPYRWLEDADWTETHEWILQ